MNKSAKRPPACEVASVRKALEILCSFSREASSFTVSDLSRLLAIPKSTTYNLLRTLQAPDFLTQSPEDKKYRLGPRVFELGLLFSDVTQLVAVAYPRLRRLAEQTKETVKLATLSDGEVLILGAVESSFQLHTRGDVCRSRSARSSRSASSPPSPCRKAIHVLVSTAIIGRSSTPPTCA